MVAILVPLLAACDGATSPTAPSAKPDRRFDDLFWRDLIYNERDRGKRGDGRLPGSRIVNVQRNYAIDPEGMPDDIVQSIRTSIPILWEQVTGEPFAGEIIIGERRGLATWTTVSDFPLGLGLCGAASYTDVDGGPGGITLNLRNASCAAQYATTFAHELGHDLGLSHVYEPGALMSGLGASDKTSFMPKEQYHAQLAYEVGWGKPYCGWPYGPGCQ